MPLSLVPSSRVRVLHVLDHVADRQGTRSRIDARRRPREEVDAEVAHVPDGRPQHARIAGRRVGDAVHHARRRACAAVDVRVLNRDALMVAPDVHALLVRVDDVDPAEHDVPCTRADRDRPALACSLGAAVAVDRQAADRSARATDVQHRGVVGAGGRLQHGRRTGADQVHTVADPQTVDRVDPGGQVHRAAAGRQRGDGCGERLRRGDLARRDQLAGGGDRDRRRHPVAAGRRRGGRGQHVAAGGAISRVPVERERRRRVRSDDRAVHQEVHDADARAVDRSRGREPHEPTRHRTRAGDATTGGCVAARASSNGGSACVGPAVPVGAVVPAELFATRNVPRARRLPVRTLRAMTTLVPVFVRRRNLNFRPWTRLTTLPFSTRR